MNNETNEQPSNAIESSTLLADLSKMARRWRRKQGGAGGACVQLQEANQLRNEGRLQLIKELEAFIKENS